MDVAVLGTGRMGSHLVRHLLEGGHDVRVWNRTAERTEPLVDAGARAAATPAEAVEGADAVVTVLFGPPSVRQTVLDPGVLPAGVLWLDVTTVGPDDADGFARRAEEAGVRYVAAPVIGSMKPAAAGELGVLLGGADADVAAARELVALWGAQEKIREVGAPRNAAAGKLVANLSLAVAMQGVAEALTFAGDVGLDRATTLALLSGGVLAPIVGAKQTQLDEQEFDDAEFTADALAKDLELVLEASLGLHAVQAAHESLQAAQDDERGSADFSVITDV